MLTGLGCGVTARDDSLDVVVPPWRPDLEREIDLIEEIARLYGYDRFPLTMPTGRRGFLTARQLLRRRVRQVLMGGGLSQAFLSSFLSSAQLQATGDDPQVRVTNPMSAEQEHLRPSLLPSLLSAASYNAAHGVGSAGLFEVGTVFVSWPPGAELPAEELRAAAVMWGRTPEASWHSPSRPVDAFDAKGIVALLLEEIGIQGWGTGPCDHPALHPGRSASVEVDGQVVGLFGEVRPRVRRRLGLGDSTVAVLELSLDPLLERAPARKVIEEAPRFPAVIRDISMIVGEDVPAAEVAETISRAAGPALESLEVIDVYEGEALGPTVKSLAFRLTLRARDRTMTDEQADAVRASVESALRESHRAVIR